MKSDSVKGGKGDNAKPSDFTGKEVKIGVAVELEHTDDKKKALEIALDHLTEDPHYYSKLVKSGLADEPEAIKIANEEKLESLLRQKIQQKLSESIVEEELIEEGVDDPNILKAVFLVGGAGSGKTFVGSSIFDMPEKTPTVSALGLKMLSSDITFVHFLKKINVSPATLMNMPPAEYAKLTTADDSPRAKGKALRNKQFELFTKGRLGVVIDGTGQNFTKTKSKKDRLEKLGYDTFMVIVKTSLPVALANNRQRDRKLPEDLVKQIWRDVDSLMDKSKSEFGSSNFAIVDNSERTPVSPDVVKKSMAFLRKPIKNSIGQKWIKIQRFLKKQSK